MICYRSGQAVELGEELVQILGVIMYLRLAPVLTMFFLTAYGAVNLAPLLRPLRFKPGRGITNFTAMTPGWTGCVKFARPRVPVMV